MNSFPKIMGILNVTPDSFSDGGRYTDAEKALARAEEMIADGAEIIDIGGESSRPGADYVDEETEIARVIPAVEIVRKNFPETGISVDTRKYTVARAALGSGADIINDISGLSDYPEIAGLAAEHEAALVIMHMQGTPRNMQKNPGYSEVVNEIASYLKERADFAKAAGVKKIYVDAGIGFGKSLEHNRELIRNYEVFSSFGYESLIGISRKSFIGKITGEEIPERRDTDTALLHSMLLGKNIGIIRVHNTNLLARLRKIAGWV